MIDSLFADPGHFRTPESVVAEYFNHRDEIVLFMACPRCHSLNIKMIEVESRRMILCHDCGDLCEAPPLN